MLSLHAGVADERHSLNPPPPMFRHSSSLLGRSSYRLVARQESRTSDGRTGLVWLDGRSPRQGNAMKPALAARLLLACAVVIGALMVLGLAVAIH